MKNIFKILIPIVCLATLCSCVASNEILTITNSKWTFDSWDKVPIVYKLMTGAWYLISILLPLYDFSEGNIHKVTQEETMRYGTSMILIYFWPYMFWGCNLVVAMLGYQIATGNFHTSIIIGVITGLALGSVNFMLLRKLESALDDIFYFIVKVVFYLTCVSLVVDVVYIIYWYIIK
jgi:hypothetical protein